MGQNLVNLALVSLAVAVTADQQLAGIIFLVGCIVLVLERLFKYEESKASGKKK